MPDQSLSTIPFFGDADFYVPLKTAEQFKFSLSYHIIDKKLWCSVQDWLVGLVGDESNARKIWTKFQNSDSFNQLSTSGRQLIRSLDYVAADGKTYQTDHGSESLLYHLTIYVRTTKKRPQVAAVKAFLAEAGVIVGDMIRDPEGMAVKLLQLPDTQTTRKDLREIRRATDNGYSFEEGRQRIAARTGLVDANKRVRQERASTGLVQTPGHWAALNLEDFHVSVGMTQDEWREANGMVEDINEHLSTLDLVTLTYVKETIADKLAQHCPQTYTELFDMISSVREEVVRIRRIYGPLMPRHILKDTPKAKQLSACEDTNDSSSRQ